MGGHVFFTSIDKGNSKMLSLANRKVNTKSNSKTEENKVKIIKETKNGEETGSVSCIREGKLPTQCTIRLPREGSRYVYKTDEQGEVKVTTYYDKPEKGKANKPETDKLRCVDKPIINGAKKILKEAAAFKMEGIVSKTQQDLQWVTNGVDLLRCEKKTTESAE